MTGGPAHPPAVARRHAGGMGVSLATATGSPPATTHLTPGVSYNGATLNFAGGMEPRAGGFRARGDSFRFYGEALTVRGTT